jgi:type IV pilus assembly protein PilF
MKGRVALGQIIQRKTVIALLMTLLLLAACGISREDRQKATLHYNMGVHHVQQGDPTSGLRELLEAEKYNPEDPEIQYFLGAAYGSKELYSQAIDHFQRALALNPKFTDAHKAIGDIHLATGEWNKAIQEYEIVLRDILYLKPFYVWNNLGWAYYKKGDLPKATDCFRRAIALKPDFGLAYYNLGFALRDAGRPEEAAKAFREVVRLAPETPQGRLAREYLDLLDKSKK